jgi:hypothetical protein
MWREGSEKGGWQRGPQIRIASETTRQHLTWPSRGLALASLVSDPHNHTNSKTSVVPFCGKENRFHEVW